MTINRAMLLAATLMLFGSAAPALAESVVLATEASFPPFSKTEADGTFTGFELDLGNEVCKRASFECTWVKQDFDGAIAALNAKKFDVIFSSMSIKPERRKVADFSIPYYNDRSVVFAKKGTLKKIPDDLAGKTVGVYGGATQDMYARKNFPDVTVRGYENIDQITADLRAGRIDAMFVESLSGADFLSKPEGQDFEALEPAFSDKSLGEGVGAMTRKGDERMAKINDALRAIYGDGTFDKLQAKWFPAGTDIRADNLW
jgi:lysine/arginine/ornithine transport system substrate-binding protein